MKKNDLLELKKLDIKSLAKKANDLQKEIANLVLERNTNSLKDVNAIGKKRIDLAQIMTVIRQKELLEILQTEEGKS